MVDKIIPKIQPYFQDGTRFNQLILGVPPAGIEPPFFYCGQNVMPTAPQVVWDAYNTADKARYLPAGPVKALEAKTAQFFGFKNPSRFVDVQGGATAGMYHLSQLFCRNGDPQSSAAVLQYGFKFSEMFPMQAGASNVHIIPQNFVVKRKNVICETDYSAMQHILSTERPNLLTLEPYGNPNTARMTIRQVNQVVSWSESAGTMAVFDMPYFNYDNPKLVRHVMGLADESSNVTIMTCPSKVGYAGGRRGWMYFPSAGSFGETYFADIYRRAFPPIGHEAGSVEGALVLLDQKQHFRNLRLYASSFTRQVNRIVQNAGFPTALGPNFILAFGANPKEFPSLSAQAIYEKLAHAKVITNFLKPSYGIEAARISCEEKGQKEVIAAIAGVFENFRLHKLDLAKQMHLPALAKSTLPKRFIPAVISSVALLIFAGVEAWTAHKKTNIA